MSHPAATAGKPGSETLAPSRSSLAGRFERLVAAPGDKEDVRRRKARLVIACILVLPAGVIWSALYFVFGEPRVAGIPLAYAVLTALDLVLLLRLRRYELFRHLQQGLILVLPFLLQLALGGFVGSGAVIVWSFLAVVLALVFGGTREAVGWFAAYLLAVLVAAGLQPRVGLDNHLPGWMVIVFFALNIVAVSSVAFAVFYSFVTDRRKLRQLEAAYFNQELVLRQSEKLATLGTLAAGIAHELNNPAAAARRASEQLRDAIARLEQAHLRLGAVSLSAAGRAAVQRLEQRAREQTRGSGDLDPLERSDREAAVEGWCEQHGVEEPWALAPSLVEQGLDPSELARLARELEGEGLSAALFWAATLYPVYSLLHEIGEGSARISEIVGALRGYSYVGQAPIQLVDLHEGLDNTLVILRSKLKAGIQVHRDYGTAVPKVAAFGGELNQVWTNLLDNAADAMGGKGEITIRTRTRNGWAVVEIEDDGPGIPEEIQARIFDPFFTTKAPGQGTGLGLSTSHAIITQKHKGEIRVESRPGLTRFTVLLPIEGL